ncbi:ribosome assembly RNA-binding protein YhbY [Hyalangium gracile]|uniref:ribosome assembly RNA-binding protein YhbY n=1 Tax=Hyalangium gracile TaxID=394092 RepID=UPI001CCBB6FE|nr:ribosome assembly RNA-binding protein YhbY [Hyalangium gracile]
MPLTGKQRRALRALGHHKEPVVIVGQSGVTEGILGALNQALEDHELIKVKINEGPETRQEAAAKMAEGTGSELVQLLGRTALLFKKRKKDSEFDDL